MHLARNVLFFALGFLLIAAQPSLSQSPDPTVEIAQDASPRDAAIERWKRVLNENAVTLISGNLNGGDLRTAYDIAAVLDSGIQLRVLPMIGKGAIQNMRDLMLLQGVDMGLVNLVALDHFKSNGRLGENLQSHLAYITPLFQDELHLLARPGINSIRDLEGKRVNFSDDGDGSLFASRTIFDILGLKVEALNIAQADAIEMMKRGELDASLCTCLKPLHSHGSLPKALGFKLIAIPYERPLHRLYLPVTITHDEYPTLIPKGQAVDTVAVQTLLAVYNWPPAHPRYRKLEKFTNAFFENFEQFMKPPRHPRWKSVNLSAEIPGWRRFPAAQKWLDARHKRKTASNHSDQKMRAAFEVFLNQNTERSSDGALNPQERNALYGEFVRWWINKSGRDVE